MKADIDCYACCRKKAAGLLEQYQAGEELRFNVMKEVEEIISRIDDRKPAPVLMAEIMSVIEKHIGISDIYEEPKRKYNKVLLEREEKIWGDIQDSRDRFKAGIQYAITGNYIDFGAMSDVQDDKLEELLRERDSVVLDEKEVGRLKEELDAAHKMVYITDNAGEIVLDKAFIRVLKEQYPNLDITVLVRGFPALNDATMEDAIETGLCDITAVIPNGTDIPGTPLEDISAEALRAIEEADLCIAKGQGNFETLRGCGKNIYYLFLCKCELFVKMFHVERFTPVLKNEMRIVQYA